MESVQASKVRREIVIRPLKVADALDITAMVRESGALDVNSDYAYLLMCTHFSMTSAIAQYGNESAGFVTAYILPHEPGTLFVWQICVRPAYQGLGLGIRLMQSLLQRIECKQVRFVEATINPSNLASQKLFRTLAKQHGTECKTSHFFSKDLFSSSSHEEELLFRIGPLRLNDYKE